MSLSQIPLTTSPNQTFDLTLPIDGKNLDFSIKMNYNESAQYWVMDILNGHTKEAILTSLPLVPGDNEAQNILEQYTYLGIGSIYLLRAGNEPQDRPDDNNLSSSFSLYWGDTVAD